MNRYKVWAATTSVADKKELLQRFGTLADAHDFGECDYGAFSGTPLEAAMLACERSKRFGHVWIKDFDADRWYTAFIPGPDGNDSAFGRMELLAAQSTIRDGKLKPP